MGHTTLQRQSRDYECVAGALAYLERHHHEHPSLADAAKAAGMGEFHFQKLFTRWAGISPKRFLQYLTLAHVKEVMISTSDPLGAAMEAGVSSMGRLHDLFVNLDAVTPAQYRDLGRGLQITYGLHPSPFGTCLLAVSDRGITNLFFSENGKTRGLIEDLRNEWELSRIFRDDSRTAKYVQKIFSPAPMRQPLSLFVKGTNFQIKVWEALLRTPSGVPMSYGALAGRVGKSRAVRAVASAVAANPVSYVIPCHRVIRNMGVVGEYRWGVTRKRAMVGWEMAKKDSSG
jgi:AraC family transcriptional regulator of adaptative response/methylated-DNA-[protein]-cysteine methyltransferase